MAGMALVQSVTVRGCAGVPGTRNGLPWGCRWCLEGCRLCFGHVHQRSLNSLCCPPGWQVPLSERTC